MKRFSVTEECDLCNIESVYLKHFTQTEKVTQQNWIFIIL